MTAMTDLSKHQVMLQNSKLEYELLKDSENRLRAERDVLKQDKEGYAHLLSNLESIKASIERSESERSSKMEEKLDLALKECSALRRQLKVLIAFSYSYSWNWFEILIYFCILQDAQDRSCSKVVYLENIVETTKNRLKEEKKSSAELLDMTKSLKEDLNEKNKMIEELRGKLKMASSKSIDELGTYRRRVLNLVRRAGSIVLVFCHRCWCDKTIRIIGSTQVKLIVRWIRHFPLKLIKLW